MVYRSDRVDRADGSFLYDSAHSGWARRNGWSKDAVSRFSVETRFRGCQRTTGSRDRGGGLSEWVSFADGDTVVIPAGETFFDTSLPIPDWNFARENKAAAEWTLSVRIESVVSGSARISTNLNLVVWQIDKEGYSNIRADWEPSGTKTQNPDEWTVSVSTDRESPDWEVWDVLMEGFLGMETVENEGYLGVQIDLGAAKTVNGLIANFTKSNTCYRELSVETSTDGQSWSPQGTVSAAWEAAYQSVSFTEPVETRYIRWHMFSEEKIVWEEVSVVLPGE